MIEPSSEQLKEIGIKTGWAEEYAEKRGRIAYDACLPIIAGEALRDPDDDELTACIVSYGSERHAGCVKKAFVNRLAAMTAKPDPRVEAVSKILRDEAIMRGCIFDEAAAKIVAAVDEARKK